MKCPVEYLSPGVKNLVIGAKYLSKNVYYLANLDLQMGKSQFTAQ